MKKCKCGPRLSESLIFTVPGVLKIDFFSSLFSRPLENRSQKPSLASLGRFWLPLGTPVGSYFPTFFAPFFSSVFYLFSDPPGEAKTPWSATVADPLGVGKKYTFGHFMIKSLGKNTISANCDFLARVGEGNY